MTVVAFNSEVSSSQLKHYADVVCFSEVGMPAPEISEYLRLPEHLVTAWLDNWNDLNMRIGASA